MAGLSPRKPKLSPQLVNVGFVVDKLALGQVFLNLFEFSLFISFHRGSILIYILWGTKNRPTVGRSSETCFHPIYMNNKKQFHVAEPFLSSQYVQLVKKFPFLLRIIKAPILSQINSIGLGLERIV
jgi:hypothetical protein